MTRMFFPILALSLLAGTVPAAASSKASALTPAASSRLRSLSEPGLASLRAGSPALRPPLKAGERVRLRQAAGQGHGLESMRAGAFSDRELIIGLGIVILILVLI